MAISKAKRARRRERYERNVAKEQAHKKQAWEEGKLIEENYNQGSYTAEYTKELSGRIIEYLANDYNPVPELFLYTFRRYKGKIQDLILHWSEECEKDNTYNILKLLLETYWDSTPEELAANVHDRYIRTLHGEILW